MSLEATDFTMPSGETVALRGLTGYEIALGSKTRGGDSLAINAFMIGLSMGADEKAAEPAGTEWMKTHLAGDYRAVTDEIQRLSGLGDDATKSGVDPDGGNA
jgi:hypothetical protein